MLRCLETVSIPNIQSYSVAHQPLLRSMDDLMNHQEADLCQYGMTKKGPIARQFMLGVVQTAEGLSIYHEVFDGNQVEAPTLISTVQKVLVCYTQIKRMILVADRGLFSFDNLDELMPLSYSVVNH